MTSTQLAITEKSMAELRTDEIYIPSEDAKKIYNDFVADVRKRQLSSSENFDKSILTYSAGGLAASLAFLKDFVPINIAVAPWLLYWSWALFLLATVSTIVSFLVSYEAQGKQQKIAERYYIDGDENAFNEKSVLGGMITVLNYASGAAFVFGMVFTTIFVSLNLEKAATMKSNRQLTQDGGNTPAMQKIGNTTAVEQRGLPPGTLQKIPASPSPTPSPGSNNQTGK